RRGEAAAEAVGDGGAQDESARLGPDHDVDVARLRPDGKVVDRLMERVGVRQERHDGLEHDPWLRKVGDVTNTGTQIDARHGAQPSKHAQPKRSINGETM